jgi:hypothetical protein
MLVQGSLFPLIICTRESVPFSFCSVSLSCFDLVKGLCSLFPVLLVSSAFLIYNILTFDQKKKERALNGNGVLQLLNFGLFLLWPSVWPLRIPSFGISSLGS